MGARVQMEAAKFRHPFGPCVLQDFASAIKMRLKMWISGVCQYKRVYVSEAIEQYLPDAFLIHDNNKIHLKCPTTYLFSLV